MIKWFKQLFKKPVKALKEEPVSEEKFERELNFRIYGKYKTDKEMRNG